MNIGHNFSDSHARAQALIAKERVEGLAGSEQEWLADHLRECPPCSADATATQRALRSLRTVRVPVPRDMAARTQFRVRLRAQQLFAREPRWRLIYMMCGASWVAGAATHLISGAGWNGLGIARGCQILCGRWDSASGGHCRRLWRPRFC